ncbi:amidohydrolase [Arthrobacter sp. MYb211]|uniref:amidohydrolase n=1 Tax=unclassified Arthrobacter TaxID=235627 RepID=UPI000CFD1E69|nr:MULTISPECIES: amidohydrolase [unclassified Arthrobacter]PRA12208.1 amidohydrolase [Arthrobacter sp. MYb221]PRC08670.1 amidohydrolase [Arthrobacter sp. MYb211]
MSAPRRTTLFVNGTIWRGEGTEPATSLLVEDGVIAAVGNDLGGPDAGTVVDLQGGFLMPGFGEGHAHPIFGGLEDAGPAITGEHSIEAIVRRVRDYAAAHPQKQWILGASYDGSLAEGGLFRAEWLDEAVADRPVVLRAWDYHTVWCNSKALELAGVDASTAEPELGEIPRNPDGTPVGILREWGAVDLLMSVNPGYDFEDRVEALGRASEKYARLGVTWVQDAWVEPADVEVYFEAARRGLLRNRYNLALLADPRDFPDSLPALLQARESVAAFNHRLLSAQSVKFFADGVVENETGALLEPYCGSLHNHGLSVWEPEPLAEAVAAVVEQGFQPHIHAIGDAAVRMALDAIEGAVKLTGRQHVRPAIAHVQLAKESDLERFAQLGVIAVMQPLWAQLDPLMNVLTVPRLGAERSVNQYRMRTLHDSGAKLAFGSDWPCSSANPLEGISIAISRMTEEQHPVGGWMPEEILDIEAALGAYTAGVAYQAAADRLEMPWGVLEVGCSADMVWLERDPRLLDAVELRGLPVLGTWLAGEEMYRQCSAASGRV